ncbi:MAG: hypothetical protein WBB85_20060 [Albidovulum sp.]|uniref:hypothetical protein n=1 Tax=Albidovulum sp. TaxID=1872424 RepID=UPI003CC0820E
MSSHTTTPAHRTTLLRWTDRLLRLLARWRASRVGRARVRALLTRPDDHLIDDIGETRDRLRERFGLWDGA